MSEELTFPDAAAIDALAREDVVTAAKDGIVDGYQRPTSGGCSTLRPHATRAVTVAARIRQLRKNRSKVLRPRR